MIEKKEYCKNMLDWIRKLLTYEPRGSSNSFGALLRIPQDQVLFLEFLSGLDGMICVVIHH